MRSRLRIGSLLKISMKVRLNTGLDPHLTNARYAYYRESLEIKRAPLLSLRTRCLLRGPSRSRVSSSAPTLGTEALRGGTPSPIVRIAALRFARSFGLFAITSNAITSQVLHPNTI